MFASCGLPHRNKHYNVSPYTKIHLHSFIETYFNVPTYCDHCGSLLWGIFSKQGLQCSECNYVCHFWCEPHLTKQCRDHSSDTPTDHDFVALPIILPHTTYCNVCRRLLLTLLDRPGYICKLCHYVTHHDCVSRAESNCVVTHDMDSEVMRHHWVEGNIHEGECIHCEESMSAGSGMTGFRCYWCDGCVHNQCKSFEVSCDMGALGPLKIPPCAITMGTESDVAYQISPQRLMRGNFWPLLVFINQRSGGHQGEMARESLCRLINPLQIFDLSDGGPDKGLDTFLPLAEAGMEFAILICGGDGTVSWVLDSLHKKEALQNRLPPVGILPLGTGNDLARTLGWGEGYEEEDISPLLYSLFSATTVYMDRWLITMHEQHSIPESPSGAETKNSSGDGENDDCPESHGDEGVLLEDKGKYSLKQRNKVASEMKAWKRENGTKENGEKIGKYHHGAAENGKRVFTIKEKKREKEKKKEKEKGIPKEKKIHVQRVMVGKVNGMQLSKRSMGGKIFNNYFSLGIDANVALRFHAARQAYPEKFTSRTLNKFHYFTFGASQMLQDPPMELQKRIQLEIDGAEVLLPPSLEGLVILNLPSYAGGADLWGSSKEPFKRASVGDRMLEVAGITSNLHLGTITAQATTAVQIGQGSKIRIVVTKATPCQIDGEPWLQSPTQIEIQHHSRVRMLMRKPEQDSSTASMLRALDPSFTVVNIV